MENHSVPLDMDSAESQRGEVVVGALGRTLPCFEAAHRGACRVGIRSTAEPAHEPARRCRRAVKIRPRCGPCPEVSCQK